MTITERLNRLRELIGKVTARSVEVHLVCGAEWTVLVSCPTGGVPMLLNSLKDAATRRGGGWHGMLSDGASAAEAIRQAEMWMTSIVALFIHQTFASTRSPSTEALSRIRSALFEMGPLPSRKPETAE